MCFFIFFYLFLQLYIYCAIYKLMNRTQFSSLMSKGGKNMKHGKSTMVKKKIKKNKKKKTNKKYGKKY